MNQFIDSLERMKDMPIVRFFSQFFTENRLSPLLGRFTAGLEAHSPGSMAKELFIWAILLALGTFIIDQAFYWTKPGQIERARSTWQGIASGATSVGLGLKALPASAKAFISNKREAPGVRSSCISAPSAAAKRSFR